MIVHEELPTCTESSKERHDIQKATQIFDIPVDVYVFANYAKAVVTYILILLHYLFLVIEPHQQLLYGPYSGSLFVHFSESLFTWEINPASISGVTPMSAMTVYQYLIQKPLATFFVNIATLSLLTWPVFDMRTIFTNNLACLKIK